MPTRAKTLGIMKPLGGGDPIPLEKEEIVVGRRPTSDVRLDFENVSGRHCMLRLVKGVWHVRDLNSTNGTTVNGQRIDHEHGLMPDDELGVSSHFFMIDYDPIAPTSIQDANQVLEEEIGTEPRRNPSLMELAGLESERGRRRTRPERAPDRIERPSAKDADFGDNLPGHIPDDVKPVTNDDDFFKMIQDDVDIEPKKPNR